MLTVIAEDCYNLSETWYAQFSDILRQWKPIFLIIVDSMLRPFGVEEPRGST